MKKITSDIRSAFSLMEMMIVLLIISIIAAASMPLVSKKMSRDANNSESPWMYTNLQGTMAYNINGNNNQTAIIGATATPNSNLIGNPRLYIDGNDGIAIGNDGTYHGSIKMPDGQANRDSWCIAIGQRLGTTDDNIFIGTISGASGEPGQGAMGIGWNIASEGSDTLAVGHSSTAHGSQSVALGTNANAQGDNSIAIGSAGPTGEATVASQGNSIAIGHHAQATGNNSIAIGNGVTATNENDVVIGTALQKENNTITIGDANTTVVFPGTLQIENLDINNTLRVGHHFELGTSAVGQGIAVSGERDRGGSVNIDVLTYPSARRNPDFGGLDNGNDDNNRSGGGRRSPAGEGASDRRLKNVGAAFTDGLDAIKKIELFHFTFKNDEAKTPHVGVMAQDLQKIFPDAVKKGEDGYLRIRMEDMFYALINAVKELDTRISEAVNQVKTNIDEISKLKATVAEQQATIEELKARVEALEKNSAKPSKSAKKASKDKEK